MLRIGVNKVASVTRKLMLGQEVSLTEEITPRPGAVIAGRILNDKTAYNALEDVHGRMSRLKSGDIIVGALGERKALHGYEGYVPQSLEPGERINVLNLGGVLGLCTAHNASVGPPFELEVFGQVLTHPVFQSRRGTPASICWDAAEPDGVDLDCPVIVVCGACMNSGKTAAACAIVNGLSRMGLSIGAGKLTGVSLMQDVLLLRDYGAAWAYDFTDVGEPSTNPGNAPAAARRIYHLLGQQNPDLIIVEMGDGIFGEYGVQQILADPELAGPVSMVVYCANDPAGAYGGVRTLVEQYGIQVNVVSGPVTDNLVGTRYIQEGLGLAAINARKEPAALAELVARKMIRHPAEVHCD